jgi:hypothetical protein
MTEESSESGSSSGSDTDGAIAYVPLLFVIAIVVCAQLNCMLERWRFGEERIRSRSS